MSLVSLLLWLISVATLLFEVVMLVDAAVRPAAVWRAGARQPKALWLAILGAAVVAHLLFGLLGMLGLAGLVAAIVYAVDTRRRLRAVTPARPARTPRGGIGPTPWS